MFGGAGPYINVYSLGGMIFVEGLLWSPLAFLLLSPVFRNSDASFEEAASICGAGLFSTLRHVTLGMARPALLALGLLVFIKASESFEVPALVGLPGSTRVLTSTIYQRLDAGHAAGHRQRLGLRRAAARRHGGPAADLRPRRGADPSLSDRHRKGISPARDASRPLALRRGRADRRYSLRRRGHSAGDDPVGGAAAVLSAVQHQGAAVARLRQFRAGA